MRLRRTSWISKERSSYLRVRGVRLAGLVALIGGLTVGSPLSAIARVHSYIVEDAQTGAVLEAKNADVETYPASLAKLMTLYLTFRRLADGRMWLSERLPVSAHAAAQPPTKLWLRPGSTISVQSAILGITTRSANDAAVVLAEAIGGTETHFADMMNQTAEHLGMTRTTFRNASGLPNPWEKTTARDMATLALALIHQFPQYYHYFGTNTFDFRGRIINGFDYLLEEYPGVDGMKTGYTYASGYDLVTSAVRDGRRLVAVVMGGSTAYSRDRLMEALLNRGFTLDTARAITAKLQPAQVPPAAMGKSEKATHVSEPALARPSFHWLIQLGMIFRSPYQVRLVLKSAYRTDPESLKSARPVLVRLRGGRYLARFANLTEAQAEGTCQTLRGRRYTCNVLRDPSLE